MQERGSSLSCLQFIGHTRGPSGLELSHRHFYCSTLHSSLLRSVVTSSYSGLSYEHILAESTSTSVPCCCFCRVAHLQLANSNTHIRTPACRLHYSVLLLLSPHRDAVQLRLRLLHVLPFNTPLPSSSSLLPLLYTLIRISLNSSVREYMYLCIFPWPRKHSIRSIRHRPRIVSVDQSTLAVRNSYQLSNHGNNAACPGS